MTTARLLRFSLIPPIVIAALIMLVLAAISFRLAIEAGTAEALMMTWVLFFVVGLPVLLVVALIAGAIQRRYQRRHVIPCAGGKIP